MSALIKFIIVYMWLGGGKIFDFVIVRGILIHDEDASRIGVKDLNLDSSIFQQTRPTSGQARSTVLSVLFSPFDVQIHKGHRHSRP
eukprot:Skav205263  [mRNA]  locus=scaffold1841:126991:127941:+ [translate_table: standard]